ncbi:ribose phosphate diphosphokinase subunit PRS1 [Sugiyamaella lignohabitans]|uniref:Ribose-phosphate pyrophosphokinase 1 n=1 Tax=Sugiyamaella lignohabitans TaxID=796027 RepID=A0A167D847_9ASCO|nr:ribose phosphate diphosphokinase subunit PRS1 [Sugiyamaella lignohabitans]ANB12596.1 ribose phosphate diphosphokinase subunit PRS1 [Sugiyamaella lignohabitans]
MRKSHVFVGSSHPELGKLICDRLGVEPGPCTLRKFSNGETSIEIGVSVRDEDVYIVQSGSHTINDHIMELLTFISGCKGGSAHKITAVLPLFPYSKQSKMKKHRGAITARMLANLIIMAGADHVITMDLHASQMQGFFSKPVDNLYAGPTLARWIRQNVPDYRNQVVIVSKNPGGTKRVTALADALKVNFAMIHTDRRRHNDNRPLPKIYSSQNLPKEKESSVSPVSNGPRSLSQPRNVPALGSKLRIESSASKPDLVEDDPFTESLTSTQKGSPLAGKAHNDIVSQYGQRLDYYDVDGEEEEVVKSHEIHVARVIQGHVVDDDYPSPSVDSTIHSDDDRGTDHMMDSIHLTDTSSHALGGTVDASLSDDDEEDHYHEERLIALVGDVNGKTAVLLDDMIDRPGSFIAAAEHCRLNCGARAVFVVATHGVFSDGSLQALDACPYIDNIVVTNTYPIPEDVREKCSKLTVIDISSIFAECIRRNHHGESISALFEQLVSL